LTIAAESPPLQTNQDGVILVGKTRVTLDTVVAVFSQGTTAEEIAYRYPSLNLADIYATIAFYPTFRTSTSSMVVVCKFIAKSTQFGNKN
jgi:uncharacterized protein (DUF433 family)